MNKKWLMVFGIFLVLPLLSGSVLAGVVTDGLVHYWTFDSAVTNSTQSEDIVGSNVAVYVDNGNGLPSSGSGYIGESVYFVHVNDSDGCVEVVSDFLRNIGTGEFAVDFWIKTDDLNSVEPFLVTNYSTWSPAYWGYDIRAGGNYNLFYTGNDSLETRNYDHNISRVVDGNWHHIVVMRNSTYHTLMYVDNEFINSTSPAVINLTYDEAILYMGSQDGHASINGSMDEFKVYNKALSPSEIQQNYEAILNDIEASVYSLNSTNSTYAGKPIEHRLYWQDSVGLSGYIFRFCNGTWNGTGCTAGIVNDTWQPMTGTGNWSNVTKTVNSTVGATIAWCVEANDTAGNWNRTSCNTFTYQTTDTPPINYTCNSCTDCLSKINSASAGDSVLLNQSISGASCLFMWNNSNITLNCQNYVISGSGTGIYWTSPYANNTIKNCIIKTGDGIYAEGYNNKFYNSSIIGCTRGIYHGGWHINNSVINGTTNWGIRVWPTSLIENSHFVDNTGGYGAIYMVASSNNIVRNNIIEGGSKGIYMTNVQSGSNIYNNFFNNTDNVLFAGSYAWNHTWNTTNQTGTRIYSSGTQIGGNYWTVPGGNGPSDYCEDSDKDGFCDMAYQVLSDDFCVPGSNCTAWQGAPSHASEGPNLDMLPLSDEYNTPPTYSLNSTNSTYAGKPIEHRLYWQDIKGLSGYIFRFCNGTWNGTDCTAGIVNDTWQPMTGTGNWSNVTKTVNSTVGATIAWCVEANDTADNWNRTSCNTFTYQTIAPILNSTYYFHWLTSSTSVGQGRTSQRIFNETLPFGNEREENDFNSNNYNGGGEDYDFYLTPVFDTDMNISGNQTFSLWTRVSVAGCENRDYVSVWVRLIDYDPSDSSEVTLGTSSSLLISNTAYQEIDFTVVNLNNIVDSGHRLIARVHPYVSQDMGSQSNRNVIWYLAYDTFARISRYGPLPPNENPVVDLVSIPSSLDLSESNMNNTFDGYCLYSDPDGWDSISSSLSYIKFDGYSPINFSSLSVVQVNSTQGNVSFTIEDIPYYKVPADYTLICYVSDGFNDTQGGENITINPLMASDVNVTSVNFGSVNPGETGYTSYFKVENTGNVPFNSSWKGTNFTGGLGSIPIANCNITSMVLSNDYQDYTVLSVQNYYEPRFSIHTPLGTLSDTYTNIFTHGVS